MSDLDDLLPLTYLLPLRAASVDDELLAYVVELADQVDEVIVVDSSPASVYAAHDRAWPLPIRHVRPSVEAPMGKVANVLSGLAIARHDAVVIADDDVRWAREELTSVLADLDAAEVVRPHNRFDPAPWHARWDTGRILLNRATGGDWPGTLAVRRRALPAGYAGDCLFENLELVRTVLAHGGRERVRYDLAVVRRPPTTRKFLEQRVRQAYDERARPTRALVQLGLLPALLVGRRRVAVGLALLGVASAEIGRRRGGGTRWWPATATLWAPLWMAERSVTAWLAVIEGVRGGPRFGGVRLARAAHSTRAIARRLDRV